MPAKTAAAVACRPAPSVLAAACVLAAAAPARAQQLEQWTLADPPLFEIGRDRGDGVLFEYVGGAAVMADGSVLVADRGPRQILRLSPAGEVIEVYGGTGQGPGEFRWLQHVFAEGDTILAYDSGARRVTAWRPGAAEPEIRSLPQVNGMPTSLRAMASSTAWLVELNAYPAPDERAGLKERRREFFSFDADADEATSMGTWHVGYDFVHHVEGGNMANSVPFLGAARMAGVGGQWLFAPMDDAALELWSPGGGSPERLTLLAGSDDVAVLLGRTQDLEEQFVQVRRIVRGSGP